MQDGILDFARDFRAAVRRTGRFAHGGETITHALYCAVLFVEGHGLYATIGGIVGVFVVWNAISGGGE